MHILRDQALHAEGNINSFDDAMELIHKLWKKVNPECPFSEEAPVGSEASEISVPIVVYDSIHRKHSEQLSDGRKPRVMKTLPDPDQPGHNLTESSEWFDCIAEFCIYGSSKRETREWATKLESFILTYTGYLKQQGIAEILFLEELPRGVSSEYRQDIPHRRLRYLVKIQRTQTLRSIRMDTLDVVAKVPSNDTKNGFQTIYPSKDTGEFLSLYEGQIRNNVKEES